MKPTVLGATVMLEKYRASYLFCSFRTLTVKVNFRERFRERKTLTKTLTIYRNSSSNALRFASYSPDIESENYILALFRERRERFVIVSET